MDTNRKLAIDSIDRRIARLQRVREEIKLLPKMDTLTLYESLDEICMSVPYDPRKISAVRRALGRDWRVSRQPRTMDDGDWVVEYEKKNAPDVHITLFAHPFGEGATCRRVKAGTRTVEIYRIECNA